MRRYAGLLQVLAGRLDGSRVALREAGAAQLDDDVGAFALDLVAVLLGDADRVRDERRALG
jgi:hypothetical protein